jgi:hypothetical protein
VVPDTAPERVRDLLAAAWAQDPLTALKLACNLRGVRGTGKSDKEGFYAAALWMHEKHPKTLAGNVPALAEFGYLKDFPELLYRLIHGADVRMLSRNKAAAENAARKANEARRAHQTAGKKRGREGAAATVTDLVKPSSSSKPEAMLVGQKKVMSKHVRKAARLAVQSLETYYGDHAYRFLFDNVADLLASDMKQLEVGGKRTKIGLVAKWCPTPGSSFDRTTLLCEAVARRLFPRDSDPDYADLLEEHYAYRALRRLRREGLVPLRQVLEFLEVYMSAQQWSELPYARVASVAMRRYKTQFKKHDEARFGKYLEDVEAGKAKIAAGALLPHEIAAAAFRGEEDEVSELQWTRMVEDLRKKGSLRNCIAVCDVSGSMSGSPMEVCCALGLLISELSEKPWKGRVVTFSTDPEIHKIEGKTLQDKLSFVQRMQWDMNTNFQAVFDRILSTAVDGRLPPEKMIRTVFVFSDMEFDQAQATTYYHHYWQQRDCAWETDYQVICRKFRDAGYGGVVPQIVFWNLRDSRSTPVTSTQPGVAMVSGFAKNLVKIFLENDGVVNAEAVMKAAIAGEEYQKLAIFD